MPNKVKKILFIVTQSEFGGAQRFLWNLISGLTQISTPNTMTSSGTGQAQKDAETISVDPRSYPCKSASIDYEVVVAAGPEGDDEQGLLSALEKKGINTKHLKYLKRDINPLFDFLGLIEIYKLIKKEKPNTVFLCSSKAGVLGSFAATLIPKSYTLNPKVIYRIGGWTFNDPGSFLSRFFYKFIEKFSARWKDVIIVNAECHRKQAIELGIKPKKKIITIYNGIDVNKLDFLSRTEARKELSNKITDYKLRITDYIVGTIANDYPSKGLKYFKKAKYELRDTNCKFIIIGTGNRFIIDAYKYLKAFDIFVLPSVKEGFPWTILEAMAAEVPIVATSVGAVPEIIENNKTGILVTPGNPKELVGTTQKLLTNKDLGLELAQRAKILVKEKFTLEKMVSEVEKIL